MGQVLLPFGWNSFLVIQGDLKTTLILTLLKRMANAILSHRLWEEGTAPAPDTLHLQELILLVYFARAICTVLGLSQANAAPSLSGVKSTNQNRDASISCKPNQAFLLSFEAAVFLLSLSVLSPCAFPHQKLAFPIIEVLGRFPILSAFFPPTLSRKENVNEQELN